MIPGRAQSRYGWDLVHIWGMHSEFVERARRGGVRKPVEIWVYIPGESGA